MSATELIKGGYCTKCKNNSIVTLLTEPPIYQCMYCDNEISEEEYKRLVNNKLRKLKLTKLNDNK